MSEPATLPVDSDLPDDLPPVKPPSVVFIFQLFVVPGLIIAAVIAAWLVFGKLASGDQDWESLLAGVTSPNHHIRYRSMEGLATALDYDRRLGEQGKQLAQNSKIAQVLSEELNKKLASTSNSEETINDEVFLARALGSIDQTEWSLSPLIKALDSRFDFEVRKSAAISLAVISGRELEWKTPLSDPALSEAIIELSNDVDVQLRRAAAYTLGLIETPESMQRLRVLLENPDDMTSINAAIALSRRGSTDGFTVLKAVLSGKVSLEKTKAEGDSATESIIYHNVLKAVSGIAGKFSPEQKVEITDLVTKLSKDHAEIRIRTDAQAALTALKSAP